KADQLQSDGLGMRRFEQRHRLLVPSREGVATPELPCDEGLQHVDARVARLLERAFEMQEPCGCVAANELGESEREIGKTEVIRTARFAGDGADLICGSQGAVEIAEERVGVRHRADRQYRDRACRLVAAMAPFPSQPIEIALDRVDRLGEIAAKPMSLAEREAAHDRQLLIADG